MKAGIMKNNINAILTIFKMFLKNNKKSLIMYVVLGLITEAVNILNVIIPAFILQLILNAERIDGILISVVGLFVTIMILGYFISSMQIDITKYSQYVNNTMYYYLNGKATQIDLSDVENNEIESLYFDAFDNIYRWTSIPFTFLMVLLSKSLSLVIMSYLFWRIDFVIMIFVIFSIVIQFILEQYKAKKEYSFEKQISSNSYKEKYTRECMQNFSVGKELRVYNAADFILRKYKSIAKENYNISKEQKEFALKFDFINEIISLIRIILVYAVALQKYFQGALPISQFVIYIGAISQMTSSIWQLFLGVSSINKSLEYYKDFNDYLNLKESLRIGSSKDICDKEEDVIIFENVSFKYPNQEEYALKNISFSIKENQVVSIVGDNGSGKSTLIKLLLKLYEPAEGEIRYRGKNIKEYDYNTYQSFLAPVFQDYMTYAYTIKENIIFDKRLDKELLDYSINQVGLSKKISEVGLDANYTKRFDDNGVEFSGGQEQRLALARAFYKKSNILILDEPTASIDPKSEQEFFENVFTSTHNKSCIFISHRMASTLFSDVTIVLDKGKLVEMGNYKSLLKNNNLYKSMFDSQSKYYI